MKFEKVKSALKSILAQFNSVVTDKGTLTFDDELAEGVAVMLVDEEGNEKTPEDGDYYLGDEDGRTITVEGGIVKEIKTKDEVEVEPETTVEASKFSRIKAIFEESYADKEWKIIDAIRALGFECYLVEAGDDYAVVELWNGEYYAYNRFEITSWDEEGNPVIGEHQEVKSAFVPVEENVPEVSEEVREEGEFADEQPVEEEVVEEVVEEIKEVAEDVVDDVKEDNSEYEQRIADLEALVEELKGRIKELENEPAEMSAKEKFKKQYKTTADEQFSNLMRYAKK